MLGSRWLKQIRIRALENKLNTLYDEYVYQFESNAYKIEVQGDIPDDAKACRAKMNAVIRKLKKLEPACGYDYIR